MLAVPGEGELLAVSRALTSACIPHRVIREPDAPWCGQATAIGVYPSVPRERARAALGGLPLLREAGLK